MDIKWDERFMDLAAEVAKWSKDPSAQVGAIVVGINNEILSTGYNGPPRGVNDDLPERWERPAKYNFIAHAEANAVYNAARNGVALEGCTMYIHALPPCCGCAQAIIQSGIKRIVVMTIDVPERWKASINDAMTMLSEAGVDLWVLGSNRETSSE